MIGVVARYGDKINSSATERFESRNLLERSWPRRDKLSAVFDASNVQVFEDDFAVALIKREPVQEEIDAQWFVLRQNAGAANGNLADFHFVFRLQRDARYAAEEIFEIGRASFEHLGGVAQCEGSWDLCFGAPSASASDGEVSDWRGAVPLTVTSGRTTGWLVAEVAGAAMTERASQGTPRVKIITIVFMERIPQFRGEIRVICECWQL